MVTPEQLRDNERTAKVRVGKCTTVSDCTKMEQSLKRLYTSGALNDDAYRRLDITLLDRRIRIEHVIEEQGGC